MGFAHGTLLKNDLIKFFPAVWKHLEASFSDDSLPKWLPPWVADKIALIGLEALLEITADATYMYTPNSGYWFE